MSETIAKVARTPGPWTATRGHCDGEPQGWFDIDGAPETHPDGYSDIKFPQGVCMVYDHFGAGEANARLIAAAPDLLAALKEVERHCLCGARPESPQTHPHVLGCPVGAAIAKAEGAPHV